MSGPLRGVVVGHAALAEAMVAAVEEITGVTDALVAVSNAGCDRASLEARVREALAGAPAILFVDLPCGSCFVAAMQAVASLEGVRVVTGVNLTMLLVFVFHREATLAEAAARAGEIGAKAIADR